MFNRIRFMADIALMKNPRQFVSLVLGIVVLVAATTAAAQSNSEESSVADAARNARAEKNSRDHVIAHRILNEENRPHAGWQKLTKCYYGTIPPSSLSVLAPLTTRRPDAAHTEYDKVRVFMGDTIWSESFSEAIRQYLSTLIRGQYNGARVIINGVEDTSIGERGAILIHFNFEFRGIPHQGMALFVSAPLQVMSMGCVYRKQDWQEAATICDDVINSAEVAVPTEYRPFKKPF